MHKIIISLSLIFILISACTEDGDIYDSKKHKKSEFSAEKTIGLIIGAAIVGAAASEYSGGGSSGIIDYDHDWDYQAGDNSWVCRGVQTGQYAELSNCAFDTKDDDRWPN